MIYCFSFAEIVTGSDAPDVLADNVKACRSFGIQSRLEDSCATIRNKMLAAQR
jgi:hypothetical protein